VIDYGPQTQKPFDVRRQFARKPNQTRSWNRRGFKFARFNQKVILMKTPQKKTSLDQFGSKTHTPVKASGYGLWSKA